jgi:glycosyltransferase involved in cell wall biosynthesis
MTTQPRSFVLFSSADWNTRYWTNKQHNAALLAARGYKVLYVETVGLRAPSFRAQRDLRRLWTRLVSGLRSLFVGPEEVLPNLWVLSPLVMIWGRRYRIVRDLNTLLLKLAVRRHLRRQQMDRPEIWTYHPFVLDVIEGLRRGNFVYHSVDDLMAIDGIDKVAFAAAEQRLLREVDLTLVTARVLEKRYAGEARRIEFISNVVDFDHFAKAATATEPSDLAAIPHPRLGYHGVLSTQKLDIGVLAELMEQNPGWQLVLIGDEWEGQEPNSLAPLRRLANVHFLGGRPYADLPAYLGSFDVGLVPLAENAYTASMFPMKLYEFFAAGLPVAATDAPYTVEVVGPIAVASGAVGLADAIHTQLQRGRLTPEESREAVGAHTYSRRLDDILALTADGP